MLRFNGQICIVELHHHRQPKTDAYDRKKNITTEFMSYLANKNSVFRVTGLKRHTYFFLIILNNFMHFERRNLNFSDPFHRIYKSVGRRGGSLPSWILPWYICEVGTTALVIA